MSCENAKHLIADEVAGALSHEDAATLASHLACCPSCRAEHAASTRLSDLLDAWPEEAPSPSSRARFYQMLEAHQQGSSTIPLPRRRRLLPVSAAMAAALVLAFCAGLWLPGRGEGPVRSDLDELNSLRQTVSLSLMEHRSPAERLEGVRRAGDGTPGRRVWETLLHLVDTDPNVNVRLAAVEALFGFRSVPEVRAGMVHALADQDDPLIQIALIDALVVMEERDVEAELETLLSQRDLEPLVRERATRGLEVFQ